MKNSKPKKSPGGTTTPKARSIAPMSVAPEAPVSFMADVRRLREVGSPSSGLLESQISAALPDAPDGYRSVVRQAAGFVPVVGDPGRYRMTDVQSSPYLVEIELDLLDPHPHNALVRVGGLDEGVITSFEAHIRSTGSYPKDAATTIRPRPRLRFQIVKGHHRFEGSKRAGRRVLLAYIDPAMSDMDAELELVRSNNQARTSSLGIGLHALEIVESGAHGGGHGLVGGLREYARKINKDESTVRAACSAALVYRTAGLTPQFSGKATHLAEVVNAPEELWPALADRLLEEDWSVTKTKGVVKALLPGITIEAASQQYEIAAAQSKARRALTPMGTGAPSPTSRPQGEGTPPPARQPARKERKSTPPPAPAPTANDSSPPTPTTPTGESASPPPQPRCDSKNGDHSGANGTPLGGPSDADSLVMIRRFVTAARTCADQCRDESKASILENGLAVLRAQGNVTLVAELTGYLDCVAAFRERLTALRLAPTEVGA